MTKLQGHLITVLLAVLVGLAIIGDVMSGGDWTPIVLAAVALGGGYLSLGKIFAGTAHLTTISLLVLAVTGIAVVAVWFWFPDHKRLAVISILPAMGLLTGVISRIVGRREAS